MNCFTTRTASCLIAMLLTMASAPQCPADDRQTEPAKQVKMPHSAFAPVKDDPNLPRVLLLGDSISIGYTESVRSLLAGKANVHRAMENCGPTSKGVKNIDRWLGENPWDVVHFNFGLHDLKYVNDSGSRVDPEGGQLQVSPEQYEQNLCQIIGCLRETGAALIWCTTTPVPDGAEGRRTSDVPRYNQIAARAVRQTLGEERTINDLYEVALPRLDEIQQKANVHFTPAGSWELGEQVASIIERHLPRAAAAELPMATGVVFHDANGNGSRDSGEQSLSDVRVSNGREIVATNSEGRYRLPADDDKILFVIKPRGWQSPIRDNMLPKFYYIHKPAGSPKTRFPGVAPTGPLPNSVDFPLTPREEPDRFKAILFGDPQPRDQKEVNYTAHDVVEELIGTDASFGVTLGDIVFNNLDLFESQARAIAVLGIPWYNVLGNHDINQDVRRDQHSDETFERVFGPSYYAFDYGPTHFLVLDDVEWLIDEEGKGRYQGGLGADQLAFIRRDLEMIPDDQLVVLMMHIPLLEVRDRARLFRMIEKRPFCMSISAHRHIHQHRFITRADGWRGPKPHHHVIHVTACGSWWSGMPDERGIPHTLMADGAPNGYSIISFDGHQYQLDFKAAGRPREYQMNIHAPEVVKPDASAQVLVNVFNGSQKSTVEMSLGDQKEWSRMEQVWVQDPAYVKMHQTETAIRKLIAAQNTNPDDFCRQITGPAVSSHLWRANLPTGLAPGTHCIQIRTTDMHGRTHIGYRTLRVAD